VVLVVAVLTMEVKTKGFCIDIDLNLGRYLL
jgi:hypothetical protein